MRKKLFVSVFVGILLILLFFCFFPIKWKISQECDAYLIYGENPGERQEVSIKLLGEYKFYLFRADSFEGSIQIEGFPETSGEVVLKMERGVDNLVYRAWDGQELHSESFGMISAGFGMKNFVILKNDSAGAIALNGDAYYAIVSEGMDMPDVEAFREKLRKEAEAGG